MKEAIADRRRSRQFGSKRSSRKIDSVTYNVSTRLFVMPALDERNIAIA
jgi:hypothetical protein